MYLTPVRPPGKDLFIILTKHPIVFPMKTPIAERKSSESGGKINFDPLSNVLF